MVDMRVGDDNLAHGQAMFLQPGENLGNVISWIDDHGFVRSLVTQDGAVAAKRADGKGLEDHFFIVGDDFGSGSHWLQCGHENLRGGRRIAGLVWAGAAALPYAGPVPAGALAMLGTVVTYFSFFTILTNLLVALVFTAVALPAAGWWQFFAARRCKPALPLTSRLWESSTVSCCGNCGIRTGRNGLPTYCSMT